ncbi:MAG TPA: hypothetical protein VGR88_06250, partial [Ktedonobacterales bacterium]|nr:hypothetical protein [Ktedonobacterales bacterium]
ERSPMPDAEVVARLFHEAYERLAPVFGYVTRKDTRVEWEHVPDLNRRLMIASAAEVLAQIFGSPVPGLGVAEGSPPTPEPPMENDLSLVVSEHTSREASS